MEKVRSWLQADKAMHIIVSAMLVAFFLGITGNLLIGAGLALVVGLVKEFVVDKWMKLGVYNLQDMVANIIGVAIGAACCGWLMLLL